MGCPKELNLHFKSHFSILRQEGVIPSLLTLRGRLGLLQDKPFCMGGFMRKRFDFISTRSLENMCHINPLILKKDESAIEISVLFFQSGVIHWSRRPF